MFKDQYHEYKIESNLNLNRNKTNLIRQFQMSINIQIFAKRLRIITVFSKTIIYTISEDIKSLRRIVII